MISIRTLWDRFRIAQAANKADAALCLRHAIEAHGRCDYASVLFWHRQAEMCES
jgi:hypothetical protein